MARRNSPAPGKLPARLTAGLRGAIGRLRLPGRKTARENSGVGAEEGWEAAPRYFLLFLALFTAGMILISLLGDQGLIAYYRLQGEARRLGQEVERLREEQSDLGRRIAALNEDPRYIELLARQRLGLVRPGDVVVQLPRKERP